MKRIDRVQGIRRSNAAGTHVDKRTKRVRTRGDQKRRAVNEQR